MSELPLPHVSMQAQHFHVWAAGSTSPQPKGSGLFLLRGKTAFVGFYSRPAIEKRERI